MTYDETISWLFSLEGKLGMDFRLERLGPVLDRLEHPEKAFPSLHVGGTNGKGSTSAILQCVLEQAGYTTGLYTSPHLVSFRERIRVGNLDIDEHAVVAHVQLVREAADAENVALTYFEIATLVAFLEFREQGVDLAVIEVGLGGRLDATNIVNSIGVAITSIGLDHAGFLGDTIEEVAAEKAGIIKEDVPLVTGPLPPAALAVIERRADELDAPVRVCGRDFSAEPVRSLALGGPHQLENAAVARALLAAIDDEFPVTERQIRDGFARVRWPGRFEVLERDPFLVVDGGHNSHAMTALVRALEEIPAPEPCVAVFGVMADKNWHEMLDILRDGFAHIVCVPVGQSRALDPGEAIDYLRPRTKAVVAASVEEGLNTALRLAGKEGTVVVTGSIFLVGEVLESYSPETEFTDVAIEH